MSFLTFLNFDGKEVTIETRMCENITVVWESNNGYSWSESSNGIHTGGRKEKEVPSKTNKPTMKIWENGRFTDEYHDEHKTNTDYRYSTFMYNLRRAANDLNILSSRHSRNSQLSQFKIDALKDLEKAIEIFKADSK